MRNSSPFLTNSETAQSVVELGIKKANHSFLKTFQLGMLAGLFVAMGYLPCLIAMGEASMSLNPIIGKFFGGMAFSMTLSLILLVGGDLLTGNALIGLAFFNRKVKASSMFYNWCATWLGNLAGTALVAYLFCLAGITMGNDVVNDFVVTTATKKMSLTTLQTIISAFFCNVIISLAVWGSMAGKDIAGKLFLIFLCVFSFVVCGYQHSVANMFIFSYAQVLGGGFSYLVILWYLLAATVGNLLSGGIILPFLYNNILLKQTKQEI